MDQTDVNAKSGGTPLGVFVGHFVHSLDPKRRLTIPAEWREQVSVSGSLYVLPGIHETCLYVFSAQEMARRLERIRNHSISDPRARQFSRTLASRSDLVAWDVQGRIRIKDELLDHARLKESVVLVGAFERFELWAPELWRTSGSIEEAALDDAARYVGF